MNLTTRRIHALRRAISRLRHLPLLLAALLLFACSTRGDGASGSRASAGWRRLQTEHIDLSTDLNDAAALQAITALERTRQALLHAAWSKLSSTRQTERLRVVALADGLDFERYFGRYIDGVHTGFGGDTIFLWGAPRHWERRPVLKVDITTSTLRHELAHHLAAGIYGRQPRWFSEGLAQFLETIAVSEDGKKAVLGLPHPIAARAYRATRSLSVKDALAWGKLSATANERETAGLYGLSWMMVSWMFNTQRSAFDVYQATLARGESDEAAWSAGFGGWKLDEMDEALFQYAKNGSAQVYEIELAPVEVHAVPAPIGGAGVHALRAQLALVASRVTKDREAAFVAEGEREIAAALDMEPGNVTALRLSQATAHPLSDDELLRRLRAQIRVRPDDGEAWLLLGERTRAPEERETALRKAVALLPSDATAYNALAWFLVQHRRAEEALPFATKASLRAPWNAAILDTYAACLFEVGRCPDALRTQIRALDNLPERAKGTDAARPFIEALRRYQRACGGAAP